MFLYFMLPRTEAVLKSDQGLDLSWGLWVLQRLITACLFQHQAKNYLSYRLKIFAVGKKKSLGQGEREAHKVLSLQIKQVLPFYTKGDEYIWMEDKKIPSFPWHSYTVVLPCERAPCTLLKIRKGCVPWLSSWGKCTSGILGSDERNPLKFDFSSGPVACYAGLQWVGPSCWCPHWRLYVFQECSVIQPGSLLTARTFQAPFLLLGSLTY